MCAEIVLEVGARVLQRNVMLLEQRVHLESRVEPQEATDLRFGQRPCAVGVNRNRLK